MKRFKQADLIVQAILIPGSLLFSLSAWDLPTPIYCYFVVGGWQVLSMLVHWIARYDLRRWSHRAVHTVAMGLLLGVSVYFFTRKEELGFLIVMFGLAPVLAIWYWSLCWSEWRRLRRMVRASV